MTGRSAAGPCGGGGVCQWHLAARVAARDSPAGDGGRIDDAELLIQRRCHSALFRAECFVSGLMATSSWRAVVSIFSLPRFARGNEGPGVLVREMPIETDGHACALQG